MDHDVRPTIPDLADPGATLPAPDPFARTVGSEGIIWEPMWKIETRLFPWEGALLRLPALRRLHFIAHGGAAALTTAYTNTRLQHVLGVFALTARLAPDEPEVRLAALLHDVGHAPFSHSLEGIPGVDHHEWTAELIEAEPISGILRAEGIEPSRVLALAEGEEASVLKNREGVLHLDHLDSWVRSGRMRGTLNLSPAVIRDDLGRDGPFVSVGERVGCALETLIVEEAALHAQPFDLGASAVLGRLVSRLIKAGALRREQLPRMIDAEVTAALFGHEATRDEARRLWLEPWRLQVDRLGAGEAAPEGAAVVVKDRLYLDLPQVRGRDERERGERRAALVAATEGFLGTYAVSWRD